MGKTTRTSGAGSNKSKEPFKEVKARGRRKKRGQDLEELHLKVLQAKKVLKNKVPIETTFTKEVEKFNTRRKQNDNHARGINNKTGLKQGPKKICDKLLPRMRIGIYPNGAKGKTLQRGPVVLDTVNRARLECDLSKLLQGPSRNSKNIAENKLAEILHKSPNTFSDSDDSTESLCIISSGSEKKSVKQQKSHLIKYSTNLTDTDDPDFGPSGSRTNIDLDKQSKCTRRLFVESADETKTSAQTNSKHSSSGKENIKSKSPSLTVDELCWSPMTRYEQLCSIVRHENFENLLELNNMVADPSINIRMKLRSIYTKTFKKNLIEQGKEIIDNDLTIDEQSEIQACTFSYGSEFSLNSIAPSSKNPTKIAMNRSSPSGRHNCCSITRVSRPSSTAQHSLNVNYDARSVKPTFNFNREPDERQRLMMRYLADVEESRKRNIGRYPDDLFDRSDMELRRSHSREPPKRQPEEFLEQHGRYHDVKHNKHVPAILRRSNPSSSTDKSHDLESLDNVSNEDYEMRRLPNSQTLFKNTNNEKPCVKFFPSPSILDETLINQSIIEHIPGAKYKPISNLFSPKPKKIHDNGSSNMIEFGDFELKELEHHNNIQRKDRKKRLYHHDHDHDNLFPVNVGPSSSQRQEFNFDNIERSRQEKSIQLYKNKRSMRDNNFKSSQELSQDMPLESQEFMFNRSGLFEAAKQNHCQTEDSNHYDEFELQKFYKPPTVRNDSIYLTRKDSFKSGFNFALENLQSFDFNDTQTHLFSPGRVTNAMKKANVTQPVKYLAFDARNNSKRMPIYSPPDYNSPERIQKSTKYIGILKKKPTQSNPHTTGLSSLGSANSSSFVYELPTNVGSNQDKYSPCHVVTEHYSGRMPGGNRETCCKQCHRPGIN